MTDEEKSTEGVSEPVAEEVNKTEEPNKGLSLRDALEVAIEGHKEPSKDDDRARTTSDPSERNKAEKTPDAGGNIQNKEPGTGGTPALEPPSEWDKEDKELFYQASPAQQQASLKLHKKRQSMLEEIKREKGDLEWVKDLTKYVEPYLKSVGEKMAPQEALILALKMRDEFEKGKPKEAAAAYLKAKGIEPPRELLEENDEAEKENAKIKPLQDELNSIKNRLAQEDMTKARAILTEAWESFEQEKNAAGGPKYPDIVGNTESGLKLSSQIGSLVSGTTDLSKQFIANAKARIPDLTFDALLKEAYRFVGGRVDEAEAPRTQDTQKHLVKSNRAASSIPGRSSRTTVSGPVKRYKTVREAAAAAIEYHRNNEGA